MDGTGPIIRHRKTDARADRAARRAGAGTPKPPTFTGWRTSDAEEIERRRWRGLSEIVSVEALDPAHPVFGDFRVRSTGSGNAYTVEIRSLSQPLNACDCHDFRVNGLGTCKHIEGTLAALKRKRKGSARATAEAGSPRVEVYLAPGRDRSRKPRSPGRQPNWSRAWPGFSPGPAFLPAPSVWTSRRSSSPGSTAFSGKPLGISGPWSVSRQGCGHGSPIGSAAPSEPRREPDSLPTWRRTGRVSTSSRRRSFPTSARARFILLSASGPSSPTRWASARPFRRSPPVPSFIG